MHRAIALLLCLACLSLAQRADATTYYLKPSTGNNANTGTSAGSPWKTMNKVQATVTGGDTVNILAGTYTASQYTDDGSWIDWTEASGRGSAGNLITIQANPGDTVTLDGQFQNYFINFRATAVNSGYYLVVQNLRFLHYAGVAIGIRGVDGTTPSHHLAVLNCTFTDFSDNQSGAIGVGNADHIVLRGNTITNMGDPALGGQGIPDSQHAIYIAENVTQVVIDQNRIEKISGFGLHNYGHGMAGPSTYLIERQNQIVNVHASSIILTGTGYDHVYLYQNTLFQDPVPFSALDGNAAEGGITFHLVGGTSYSTPIVVVNNIIYGSFTIGALYADNSITSSAALLMDNNLFQNVANASLVYMWAGPGYTRAGFLAATSNAYDLHGQTTNPLFTNSGSRDFTLQGTSPAINAGKLLTTTVGTSSGTAVTVGDAGFFTDGFGLVPGDTIQIGAQPTVQITAVNTSTNVLTLAASRSWSTGQGVALAYSSTAPDQGAYEVVGGSPPRRHAVGMNMN